MPEAEASPLLSVVVRSHNDEKCIGRTIEALLRQTLAGRAEFLSFDDNSTDRTKEIVASFPRFRSVPPPSGDYFPGRTLNAAVREAAGEFVVFNNADAIPLDADYLERLLAPLRDGRAEAVFANQLCRPDAEALVRKDNERAFGDGRIAAKWRHFFSLAASAAGWKTLADNPFDEALLYSEDIEWSYRLRQHGGRVVYVADARVEHSHNYTPEQLRRRFYNEGVADAMIYGGAPDFKTFLRQFAMEVLRDWGWLLARGEFLALASSPPRRWRQKFSAYRGARAGLLKRGAAWRH